MTMLLILVLLVFRWVILQRFLGTKRMHLFDAIMFTFFAAQNLASVKMPMNGWSLLNVAMTGLCIMWAYGAGKRFLKFDETEKKANGKGKSDAGTAK